ncbi:MAG: DUF2130 domain-containing protein [Planctomycetes bacterium]|nr:DUF2130 domain-containing protein [Planctomycetota bacterium]
MQDIIHCPSCGCEITVSETLTAQIRQHLRQEFDAEVRRKDGELAKRLDEIRHREKALEESRAAIEKEVAGRVAQEQDRLMQEAKSRAQESIATEFRDLQEQLATTRTQLTDVRRTELQLRKERRQLEDEKQTLELTVSRTLDEERARIRGDAKNEADEAHRLKDADKEKLIGDLRHQIDELKRKSEQGSQQAQGEVMEVLLEDLLRQYFPLDGIEEVPVGVHGGDLIHCTFDATGEECGKILWESKRTKAWSDAWLPKLRDDQRAAKAHVAILVTEEMPKGLAAFGCIDGVWVTKREYVVGLAIALRSGLLEVARARRSMQGQQTKMEFLYQFLVGPEFQQRVEGIIEAFATMKEDLDSERRAIQRLWAKREKQIDRAMINTSGLYGDLTSILGTSLPQIGCLELTHIPFDAEETVVEKAPWN